MTVRDTIVIGASAGGVEALRRLLGGLPAAFPARVLIVLHLPATGVNTLASVLGRSTAMTVRTATDQARLEAGVALVAPPDRHLVVVDDTCLLTRGPRENGHRPAIDVLFRSAASALGARTIGVVLSGSLDDGSAGLRAICSCGGVGVVQDPDDAQHPSMPRSAIESANPGYISTVALMPALLRDLIGVEVPMEPGEPEEQRESGPPVDRSKVIRTEVAIAEMQTGEFPEGAQPPGESSGLSCPDCHGVLFTIPEGDFLRYRCRVGHAWSIESLLAEHGTAVEGALWMALRTLEEKAALCVDMSERAKASGATITSARFADQATDAKAAAEVIRGLLADGTGHQNLPEGTRVG